MIFFVPPNVPEHYSRDRGIVLRLTLLSPVKLNFLSGRPDENVKCQSTSFIFPPLSSEGVCTKRVNIRPRPLFRSISPISCLSMFVWVFFALFAGQQQLPSLYCSRQP